MTYRRLASFTGSSRASATSPRFGAAAHGTGDVRRAGARPAARQNELPERRQSGIEGIESGFERLDPGIIDDAGGRHRELAADVEQRVLRVGEGFADSVRERVGENDPEIGVQLVEIPHRCDPGRVLGHSAAVGEPSASVVPSSRCG